MEMGYNILQVHVYAYQSGSSSNLIVKKFVLKSKFYYLDTIDYIMGHP